MAAPSRERQVVIRVAVLDNSNEVMSSIFRLLHDEPDMDVVGSASDGEVGLQLVRETRPDVALVDMDLPSVKNAKLALETLRLLKFSTSNVKMVMNRSNSKAKLDNKEIEAALRMPILASIPSDGAVAASVNEGRPVVENDPKSKVARGFEAAAELIAGKIPEESGRSGLFGRK
mgnify:CR=1 FL=1